MKILITGATGLVGSQIVNQCLRQNIAVHYLTTSKEKLVNSKEYQGYLWNPDTSEIDIRCFNDVSAIINLSGASISKRWTSRYKKRIRSSRINSLKTLAHGLEKIDHSGISFLVSASAIGYYPNSLSNFYSEDEKSVDESFLGQTVLAWEAEADSLRKFGFKISKIRIGLVLSEDGGALQEIEKPIKNYVGAAFGSGEQWQSWIHLSDLARMFLFVIEKDLDGVYNGVAPNPVTNNKLVREVAEALNKPLILPNIPEFFMKLILGEMSYLLFASQRVSSKKIEDKGFDFTYQNINKALAAIYSVKRQDGTLADEFNREYL